MPALIGLVFLGLGRRTIKQALLAIHLLAMVLVAAVFFGSIRIRTPYDFVIMTLAFEVYSFGVVLLWKGGRWLWQRRKAKPGPPPPAAH